MTHSTRPPLTRAIGEAERALRARLDALLGDAGRDFSEWTLMTAMAQGETALPVAEAIERQRAGHIGSADDTRAAIHRLEREGFLAARASSIELTAAGRRVLESLRREVAAITDSIFDGLAPRDLETTHRVLVAVATRATEGSGWR